eukprot:3925132-Rhodomonas_salina.1
MEPDSVNLIAFHAKLDRICCTRTWTHQSRPGCNVRTSVQAHACQESMPHTTPICQRSHVRHHTDRSVNGVRRTHETRSSSNKRVCMRHGRRTGSPMTVVCLNPSNTLSSVTFLVSAVVRICDITARTTVARSTVMPPQVRTRGSRTVRAWAAAGFTVCDVVFDEFDAQFALLDLVK